MIQGVVRVNRKERRAARAQGRTPADAGAAKPPPEPTPAILARGLEHHQAGRLSEAEAHYRRVLAAETRNAEALHLLGVLAHQAGRFEAAIESIGGAIAAGPGIALFHNSMGAALKALDRLDEAIGHYRQALSLDSAYVDAHVNLGNALHASDDLGAAIAQYEHAVALAPSYAEAHAALGGAQAETGESSRAAQSLRRAIELDPGSTEAHNNLAILLAAEGQREQAIDHYRRAIAGRPDIIGIQFNLGVLLRDEGHAMEAAECFGKAAALEPGNEAAHYMLGRALEDQDRFEDAIASYRRALAIDPAHADAFNDLGNALKELGRHGEAIEAYSQAIAARPDFPWAESNRALVYLTIGNFADGWRDYQARGSVKSRAHTYWRRAIPPSLEGKRVFILKDQGLGDEVFFLRFAPEIKARGAWIAYRADPRIASLFERLAFLDEGIVGETEPDCIDLRLSVGDLPYLLGMTEADQVPPSIGLAALADRVAGMKERLAAFGPPPYIGVTWRAGTQKRNRLSKIGPLEGIAQALRPVKATIVALQRNPDDGEIGAFADALARPCHDLTGLNEDLEEMLALLALLDDYVCVSNTNVHLRHALGKDCRVLVPYPPDFRWMAKGGESPWFPGTPAYRQTQSGDWRPALEALGRDLAAIKA